MSFVKSAYPEHMSSNGLGFAVSQGLLLMSLTICNDCAGLWRHFEFLGGKLQDSGEGSLFRHAETAGDKHQWYGQGFT